MMLKNMNNRETSVALADNASNSLRLNLELPSKTIIAKVRIAKPIKKVSCG